MRRRVRKDKRRCTGDADGEAALVVEVGVAGVL